MKCVHAGLTALSGCHPEQNPALAGQNIYKSREVQDTQIARLVGKVTKWGLVGVVLTRGRVDRRLLLMHPGSSDGTHKGVCDTLLKRMHVCCSSSSSSGLAAVVLALLTLAPGWLAGCQ